MFTFTGTLSSSKSWMNRALIIQHYQPALKISGHGESEDVQHLTQALKQLAAGQQKFFAGAGGTTLRFLTFLVSRNAGTWKIKADQRLLERPQEEMKTILQQLGVTLQSFSSEELLITSTGWKIPPVLYCSGKISSQFISGLLLNCWKLPSELVIEVQLPLVSADYLNMTVSMLRQFGLAIETKEISNLLQFTIGPNQTPQSAHVLAEPDISSAFALASAAVIDGQVTIKNWPNQSLQPDFYFLNIFEKMNISFEAKENLFSVFKQQSWDGIDQNLKNTPDLFPVLAVLCSLADGISFLHGAENLHVKESDRFKKTIELLSLCGFKSEVKNNGLIIFGKSSTVDKSLQLYFDPDQDHRMAMAAGLFQLAGYRLNISHADVVKKSYPQFWQHIQNSMLGSL